MAITKNTRIYPKVVFDNSNVRNCSERTGDIVAIVLHCTVSAQRPGPEDLAAIGNWFAMDRPNPSSSHVCTDGDGTSGRYVRDEKKAWHCGYYNSATLGLEQIGYVETKKWPKAEIRESARWLAHWSLKYDIPLKRKKVTVGALQPGIYYHSDLGVAGGNHSDPGDDFPIATLLRWAKIFKFFRKAAQAARLKEKHVS